MYCTVFKYKWGETGKVITHCRRYITVLTEDYLHKKIKKKKEKENIHFLFSDNPGRRPNGGLARGMDQVYIDQLMEY